MFENEIMEGLLLNSTTYVLSKRGFPAEKARSGGTYGYRRNSVPLLREFCFRVCSVGPDDEPTLQTHGYNLESCCPARTCSFQRSGVVQGIAEANPE